MRIGFAGSTVLLLGCMVSVLVAQPPASAGSFGSPFNDLTSGQLSAFVAGQAAFQTVEDVSDGLGPVFNDVSCAACHTSTINGNAQSAVPTRAWRRGLARPSTVLSIP